MLYPLSYGRAEEADLRRAPRVVHWQAKKKVDGRLHTAIRKRLYRSLAWRVKGLPYSPCENRETAAERQDSPYLPDEMETGTGVSVDLLDLTDTERIGRSDMGALLAV